MLLKDEYHYWLFLESPKFKFINGADYIILLIDKCF